MFLPVYAPNSCRPCIHRIKGTFVCSLLQVQIGDMNPTDDCPLRRLADVLNVEWYAASDLTLRQGPFVTQADAWEALRAAPGVTEQCHVPGARVWPERRAL